MSLPLLKNILPIALRCAKTPYRDQRVQGPVPLASRAFGDAYVAQSLPSEPRSVIE